LTTWQAIGALIVERDAEQTETARRLVAHAGRLGIPVARGVPEAEGRARPGLGIDASKRTLRIVRHRGGAVLKPCTGRTEGLLCCNLMVTTQTVGCPLDCSYCILQAYQDRAEIVVEADPAPLLDAVEERLAQQPRRLVRVCTGQVADSLALEPEVGFAGAAVRRFADLANAVLELKTKTDRVAPLLDLRHGGRTVVSWSLAPRHVVEAEERGTASLEARLAAARKLADAGYLLGFHLDPMVTVDGDPAPFRGLVDEILAVVPAGRVAWLSMGTVRFQPAMRRTILTRFPDSRVTLGELLPDVDGKLRLLTPQRVAMYRAVATLVRRRAPQIPLYLCMEPPRIWRRALGRNHGSRADVELALAESLHRRFGLAPCTPQVADYSTDW
jgi:spore photoproduct lyase